MTDGFLTLNAEGTVWRQRTHSSVCTSCDSTRATSSAQSSVVCKGWVCCRCKWNKKFFNSNVLCCDGIWRVQLAMQFDTYFRTGFSPFGCRKRNNAVCSMCRGLQPCKMKPLVFCLKKKTKNKKNLPLHQLRHEFATKTQRQINS